MSEPQYGRDGRRVIDPPCEFGHTRQAMECPSCSERVTGEPASAEWREWHRKRYPKHYAAASASATGEGEA